ncbi:bifunctional diguanylate cyclase/phosphodiesterase [Aurantimonas sp. VKM B-3413]|uniref:putative bifunctional diguanylate cyclase/phosphodiesterase n=1 Tax=Aurantimonas sp. VKM B-3413 TaxID=2779401 RepID=UPI001E37CF71|nr:EAL domain-containing protein [Aurantimonas sp. VKM B-3413]MCB8836999.1 EAL domain-containing protein [Aurantimonas sp. VKM B-3413]
MTAHDRVSRGSTRRLTLVVGVMIVLTSLLLIGVIAYVGRIADVQEASQEKNRIENALNQSVARVLDQQKSVAWWDDAVKFVTQQPNDEFIDSNFGIFLTETYGHDEVYILNARDVPVYSYFGMKREEPQAFERRRNQLASVIAAVRGQKDVPLTERPDFFIGRQQHYDVLRKVLAVAAWKGAILTIDRRPAIVAAITIVPNVDMSLLTVPPDVLISIDWIDAPFLTQISQLLLIPDIRLTNAGVTNSSATVTEPFVTDDGQTPSVLAWTTRRPGWPLLTLVLPLVAAAAIAMTALSANMLLRLVRAADALSSRERAARHDAAHDSLSGLPNRYLFVQAISEALDELNADHGDVGVIVGYLDIDRFKDINDTLGHKVGDELIQAVGRRLREHLAPSDFLARFGGDEFAIFRIEQGESHQTPIETLVADALGSPLRVLNHDISVSTSVGLAQSPRDGRSTDTLMRHADIALYEAKRRGRAQFTWFSAKLAEELERKREIELALPSALENGEFELHYQPIVSARNNQVVGVEALSRWRHPTKGFIPPDRFISVAEEMGLMPKLGEWVIREALKQAGSWPDLEIAVNLSPAQVQHTDLLGLLKQLLIDSGARPERITLEITESLLLEPTPKTRTTLKELRQLGFRIALDDFGTGFSSLNYLIEFGFDKLKIDRSLVSALSQAGSAQTVVLSVIQLGHALGMEVVAEGIETEAEAVTMRFWGSDQLQGYLFSKALPADDLQHFVRDYNTRTPQLDHHEAVAVSGAGDSV